MAFSRNLAASSMGCAARWRCSERWRRGTPMKQLIGVSCLASASISATSSWERGDIFGDGVNVAARLEALAEPGGICITRVVRDQVRDKLDFSFEDMGEQHVKNIARPVRVYRILL